jgi:ABC-type transporter Mla subunit MlaD
MEVDPEYAPISSDARAILRQKTLLGETYVELTTGSQVDAQTDDEVEGAEDETAQSSSTDVSGLSGDDAVEPIEEGGHLEDSQVQEQVQIDEIFNALDEETRQAFQLWMKNAGIAVDGRGLDLNDAFGNVGPFSEDASDVLATLREQEEALRGVVRNTGAVFESLTARDQELAGAIVGSNRTFRALAARDESLAETFQILPTFEHESELTLRRLRHFAGLAGPLFRDLRPVARDLSPTLKDLRRLSPNARRLFRNLDPLVTAGYRGIPALRSILDQLRPTLVALDPFLAQFNPILRYLDWGAFNATDFLGNISHGTSGYLPAVPGQVAPRHQSRQLGVTGSAEVLSIYPTRLPTNRGNGYIHPLNDITSGEIGNPFSAQNSEPIPAHDCDNTGATGGLGNGQVNPPVVPGTTNGTFTGPFGDTPPYPGSTPPTSEGIFPFSVFDPTTLLTLAGIGPQPPGALAAFASCTLAPNFPAEFGGTRQPIIDADPPYNTLP